MGRKRSKSHHLPPHMAQKGQAYYYVTNSTPRKWIPLGNDLHQARLKWAELEREPIDTQDKTFAVIAERYRREVLKQKAQRTQRDYREALERLVIVFGHVPIDAIAPQDVREYMNRRGDKAKVRANREKAMLSTLYNHAREWGYTTAANPCAGVKGFKEAGRDRYVEDAEYLTVWQAASAPIQDAMDIAYLTGQRPADVLKMRLADIKDGAIEVQQNKTKKKLRILLDDGGIRTELGKVIDRIKARDRKVASLFLIATPAGKALNQWTLRTRFDDARNDAVKVATAAGDTELAARIREFQFRDIRPKAASEMDLGHASKLLGHTEHEITEKVYRRVGETVKPTR